MCDSIMKENIEMESDNKNHCGDLIIGSFEYIGDDVLIVNHIYSIHSNTGREEYIWLCSEILNNGTENVNDSWIWDISKTRFKKVLLFDNQDDVDSFNDLSYESYTANLKADCSIHCKCKECGHNVFYFNPYKERDYIFSLVCENCKNKIYGKEAFRIMKKNKVLGLAQDWLD